MPESGRRRPPSRWRRQHLDPGRLRRPRHRGQDRRGQARPAEQDPDPRAVPWPAVHGDELGRDQLASPARTARSSTPILLSLWWRRWLTRKTSSPANATWAARCAWASTRPCWPKAAWFRRLYGAEVVHERHRHRYEVNNDYPPGARGGRPDLLRPVTRRQAGRVCRTAGGRGAPVLRRHPGPSRVPVQADEAASAVQRADRGGARTVPRQARRSSHCPQLPDGRSVASA